MTPKQIERIRILRAKIESGVTVKATEWPAWQKGPKPCTSRDFSDSGGTLAEYLVNKGITEDQANPAAIYWPSYHALEDGKRCESCGRPGDELCRDCEDMLKTLQRTKGAAKSTVTGQRYEYFAA